MPRSIKARPTILVTGGTGVLGSAIVAAFCARNYDVFANYHRDQTRALAVARRTGCTLARADIRDENAVTQLFETRRFDAVVHAAGANRDALLLRTPGELWLEQMRWLGGAFLVTRAALQRLPRGARLMLVSSRVGERGRAGQCAYATGKGAMLGLMRAAAAERRDLKINAICPGFAPSPLSDQLSARARNQRAREELLPNSDAAFSVAQTCLWLLNVGLSGQILRPDCRV